MSWLQHAVLCSIRRFIARDIYELKEHFDIYKFDAFFKEQVTETQQAQINKTTIKSNIND